MCVESCGASLTARSRSCMHAEMESQCNVTAKCPCPPLTAGTVMDSPFNFYMQLMRKPSYSIQRQHSGRLSERTEAAAKCCPWAGNWVGQDIIML